MKNLFAIAAISAGIILGTSSFTSRTSKVSSETVMGNVDFKITNNTSAEFKYCVNGGHNYISSGSTKAFSYSAGQDFYLIDGSNCGKQWFEVSSDMNGKEYKLTDLL
jgi:hypothetical protein